MTDRQLNEAERIEAANRILAGVVRSSSPVKFYKFCGLRLVVDRSGWQEPKPNLDFAVRTRNGFLIHTNLPFGGNMNGLVAYLATWIRTGKASEGAQYWQWLCSDMCKLLTPEAAEFAIATVVSQ